MGVLPPHHHRLQPQPRSQGRGQPRLVRLRRGPVQQDVVAPLHRRGHGILELPHLVPAKRHPGHVIPLDQNAGAAQLLCKPGAIGQRGGQVGQREPGELIQPRTELVGRYN